MTAFNTTVLAQVAAALTPPRYQGTRRDPESYAREPGYMGIAIDGPRGMGKHRGECEALVMDWAGGTLSQDTGTWRPGKKLVEFGPDGKIRAAANIPENSPIATFNGADHFGGAIPGQAHASIFRYFLKEDGKGGTTRWYPGVDQPSQIVGARVVEQLPDGYRSFKGSGHPQVVNMMLNGTYPHKLSADYATITDTDPRTSTPGPTIPARRAPAARS